MSQVFSADSVSGVFGAAVPTSGETAIALGNFLNPPFQNAKAVVWANVTITTGTGTTGLIVRIRRNPNAENVLVTSNTGVGVTAPANVSISLQGADAIPDGRPVQYSITVQPNGATGAGSVITANVSTVLISG